MSAGPFKRIWLSPLVAVTFAAVAVTGVMMLLHIRSGMIHAIHEWIGLLFAAVGVAHLVLNWRTFAAYLRSWTAVTAILIGVVLCLVLATMGSVHDGDSGDRHGPPQPYRLQVD